jgi:hypothetical protein
VLAGLALASIQLVGIAERVLEQREGPQYVYFSVGKPVLRFVASCLLASVIMLGAIIPLVIVSLIAVFIANLIMPAMGMSLPNAISIIIMAAIYLPMLYLAIRLFFFVLPAAVAEGRVGVRRSWQLSRGNFWRIFALSLCLLIPLILIDLVIFAVADMPPTAPVNATPVQMAAFQAAAAAWASRVPAVERYWYVYYPLYGVFTVAFNGFLAALQVFAYRALVSGDTADNAS